MGIYIPLSFKDKILFLFYFFNIIYTKFIFYTKDFKIPVYSILL